MEYFIKFFYSFILPPGLFITLLLVISFLLFRKRNPLWRGSLGLCLLIYLYSIPATGILLLHPLEYRYLPPENPCGDVLVMLGGGATQGTPDISGRGQLSADASNRLLTLYQLYMKTHLPVLLSGGRVYPDSGVEAEIGRRQLIALGVPKKKIMVELRSISTQTNALYTKKILKKYRLKRPILVTSAFHMPRAVLDFQKEGIRVEPYPTDYLVSRQLILYPSQFIPSTGEETATALKEYVGIFAAKYL